MPSTASSGAVIAAGRANLAAGRALRTIQRAKRMMDFAELIAGDVPVLHAARMVGVSPAAGTAMMSDIRKGLGWQAC